MIKNIFERDINRNIEGVIKADNLSDEAVFQEVDEYVITKELSKNLDDFFDIYSTTIGKATEDIGVWISGFFGSGKSHLLKILSYILSSQRVHSDLIGELFLEKIEDDFELKNNIQRALQIPAQTILFNIDQKAEIGAKNRDDAILSVFMKVFNEIRGYYPKFGYIAQFEKDLDKQGLFEKFKNQFREISGESWESGRETIFIEKDNAAKALSSIKDISFESALSAIDQYEANYSISIEEFANEVKEYVDSKGENFRLIFCIDEVGQFIGDSGKLMLNLQTIAETLATKCKGQAWIIVTSQSAISELVNIQKSKEADFSKILARFKTKINLTSQNANEVIQKRLLEKKDDSKRDLEVIYEKIQNSLSSIVHFTQRGRQYKSYTNSQEFVDFYPLIPYQLDLFQTCIIGLSRHNVFQGKHQSTGERSMLDVVQNVVKRISNEKIGTLATFDRFFDGISSTIRGELQAQINQAINNLGEGSLDVKILKLLFMVKYVKEFNADIDNITTLLVDDIEIDISSLKENVKNSLHRLTEQVYIQKVGDVYEFLTDVEKDIENEIRNTPIEERDKNVKLSKWIYGDIIKNDKIRYEANKHDYPFVKKMDNALIKGKQEEDLAINVITPMTSDDYDQDKIIHKSLSDKELVVYLKSDYNFIKDLEMYVKTEKFIPQKQSGNISDTEKTLLISKASDNAKRSEKLLQDLKNMFAEAELYYNGKKLNITSNDINTLINNAFNEIIPEIYPHINILSKIYKEEDIKNILINSDDILIGSSDSLNEAENEVYNYLKRQKTQHQNVTLAKLKDYFTAKPYGWYQDAIFSLAASLYMKKRADIKKNSNPLNKEDVLNSLTNNREFAQTTISVVEQIDETKIKKAKDILKELFPDGNFDSIKPRDIIKTANEEYKKTMNKLQHYLEHNYSFNKEIKKAIDALKLYENLDYDNFFDKIADIEDELLDAKEDFIDPMFEFMEGEKRKIYDEIISFVNEHKDNFYYIDNDEKNNLIELIEDEQPYKANKIQKAKSSLNIIRNQLNELIEEKRKDALKVVDNIIAKLQNDENFENVPEKDRYKIIRPIQEVKKRIQTSSNIAFITNLNMLDEEYQKGIDRMLDLIPQSEQAIMPLVRISNIIPKKKDEITSQEDVEEFINDLKAKMLEIINNNKKIRL